MKKKTTTRKMTTRSGATNRTTTKRRRVRIMVLPEFLARNRGGMSEKSSLTSAFSAPCTFQSGGHLDASSMIEEVKKEFAGHGA